MIDHQCHLERTFTTRLECVFTDSASAEWQRVILVLGSLGLTGLNVIWLCKILHGVWKVFWKGRRNGDEKRGGVADEMTKDHEKVMKR